MTAVEVCGALRGMCLLDLATTKADGAPVVSPVDGLFVHGVLWFGSAHNSVRFRHIRRRPHVSAAHTRGEDLSVVVHGVAHEIDTSTGEGEELRRACREIYGPEWDSWGYWEGAAFAWIEPFRMYALVTDREAIGGS